MSGQPPTIQPQDSETPAAPPPPFHRVLVDSEDRLRPIFRSLLFLIVGYLLVVLVQSALFKAEHGLPGVPILVAFYSIADALLLLESWLFARMLDRRSFRIIGLWFYSGWGREFVLGVAIGAGLMALIVAGLAGFDLIHYRGLSGSMAPLLPRLVAAGVLFLLAAAFEEFAFRGYGFQRLVDAVGPMAAVLIFSGIFGVLHLRNPGATPLSTANTVLAGILLSLSYLKTRSLWLPIGLHWAWNFSMGPIFSLGVSGMNIGSKLFKVTFGGPDWLSGGIYGPEGSVVTTAVCLVGITWLAQTRRISPSQAMQEVLQYPKWSV